MVKFGKQLEAQLITEWSSAYLDYRLLKKDIKGAKQQLKRMASDGWLPSLRIDNSGSLHAEASKVEPADASPTSSQLQPASLVGSVSRVHDSLKSLMNSGHAAAHALKSKSTRRTRAPMDQIFVKVHKLERDPWEIHETSLQDSYNHMETAKIFFARLDGEFNKVNSFYRRKEKEFVEHAQALEKQMQALVDIRKAYEDSNSTTDSDTDISATSQNPHVNSRNIDLPLIRLQSLPLDQLTLDLEAGIHDQGRVVGFQMHPDPDSSNLREAAAARSRTSAVAPCPDLDSNSAGNRTPDRFMKMKIPLNTPSDTIAALKNTLWEKQGGNKSSNPEDLSMESQVILDKKKIHAAEKMLRDAFLEYYRGLNMLKNYGQLNYLACSKILKKYDKVTGQRTMATYLTAVESSYSNTSDKIVKLIDKVESLFTTFFTGNNRRKAMMSLRPRQKKSSHAVTFFVGLFSGCSLALLAVFAVMLDIMLPGYKMPFTKDVDSDEASPAPHNVYLSTIFPIFSMVALILIHMYMYAANLYFWRRMRINYAFIFEFKPGTELRHREVLIIASILTTVLLAAMVGHLELHTDSESPFVDLLPFGVVILLITLLFFPLNIFYRSSRVFFLTCLVHCLWSPLYKVVLADFFLADQMTSQVPMLRNLRYTMCYYFGSFFKTGNADGCLAANEHYTGLTYFVSLIPYWWRFMQCLRRFYDEANRKHLENAAKYFSAMVAVALRIQHGRAQSALIFWNVMFITMSIIATSYQIYWDLVIDWGLLRKDSSNKWLRDNLIMPKKKYIYFLAMILNVMLRLAWVQSITRFSSGKLHYQVADFTFASFEVIRRGMWNFFRIENEHLNNVGNYRATKTVPLPFEDPTDD